VLHRESQYRVVVGLIIVGGGVYSHSTRNIDGAAKSDVQDSGG